MPVTLDANSKTINLGGSGLFPESARALVEQAGLLNEGIDPVIEYTANGPVVTGFKLDDEMMSPEMKPQLDALVNSLDSTINKGKQTSQGAAMAGGLTP